jgi:hypothetical protein
MNKAASDKISLKLALKVFQHFGKTIVNFEPEQVNFVLRPSYSLSQLIIHNFLSINSINK